jgi:hypothetical protein
MLYVLLASDDPKTSWFLHKPKDVKYTGGGGEVTQRGKHTSPERSSQTHRGFFFSRIFFYTCITAREPLLNVLRKSAV